MINVKEKNKGQQRLTKNTHGLPCVRPLLFSRNLSIVYIYLINIPIIRVSNHIGNKRNHHANE